MAAAKYGVLGQLNPLGGVLGAVYTVPAGRKAIVRIIATNTAGVTTFRVAIEVNGEPDAVANYVAYDEPIAANDSMSSVPMGLNAGDVVNVQSFTGTIAFTVTGIEKDV